MVEEPGGLITEDSDFDIQVSLLMFWLSSYIKPFCVVVPRFVGRLCTDAPEGDDRGPGLGRESSEQFSKSSFLPSHILMTRSRFNQVGISTARRI